MRGYVMCYISRLVRGVARCRLSKLVGFSSLAKPCTETMWFLPSWHSQCTSIRRLRGKTVIITGSNTGIGKETARNLYRRGAKVILACRNLEKAKAAIEDIKANPPSRSSGKEFQGDVGELAICHLDLSDLNSVTECAKNLLANEPAIHVLINNAGVMMCPQTKTVDGNDLQLQTNHLGHFLLTLLLLPKLQSSGPDSRILNVSSILHHFGVIHDDLNLEKSYTPWRGYTQSKLANVLFTRELARRLKKANIGGVNVYSLHPGIIRTELTKYFDSAFFYGANFGFQWILGPFWKNREQGAQTIIYCTVDENLANETGLYYKECGVATPQWRARDDKIAKELWDKSCRLLHLELDDNLATFLTTVSRKFVK